MANLETKITLSATDKASAQIRAVANSLDRLKASAATISTNYNALGNAAGDFGRKLRNLTLIMAGVGAGIFGLVKRYADLGETLTLTSQKTGVSVENFQKLGYAAELNKISSEELATSLQFLNKNMAMAQQKPKSPQAQMFKALGIDVKKTSDAYEVFLQLSDKFAKSSNTAEKNLFARGLLGRAGVNLIPVLNQGSAEISRLANEYERLGFVMSKDAAEAADTFGDNLQRAEIVGKGLVAMLANQFIPILNPLVVQFTEFVAANKELVQQNVKQFVELVKDAFKGFFVVLLAVKSALSPVVSAFGGMQNIVKALAFTYVAALALSFVRLVYSFGALGISILRAIPAFYSAAAAIFALDTALAPLLLAVGGIAAAIGLIGFALYRLISDFDETKQAWNALWGQLPESVRTAIGFITNVMTFGLSEIAGLITNAIESIRASFAKGGLSQVFEDMLAGAKEKVASALEGVSSLFSGFVNSIKSMFSPLLAIFDSVAAGIAKIKSYLVGGISGAVNVQTNVSGAPAGGNGASNVAPSPAPAASAGVAPKTALLTPPASGQQLAAAQNVKTKLDVYMKIDSEGRAKAVRATSSGNMDFAANTGRMV